MTPCKICELNNGCYDMSQICCRVRFLLTQHDVGNRRGWIERWDKKYGSAENEKLKIEFEKQWKMRNEKTR